MKSLRLTIEIMDMDKAGNGGIKVTQRGNLLKWFYHNRRTASGLKALQSGIIGNIGKLKGVT